jgi:hypothetical protein
MLDHWRNAPFGRLAIATHAPMPAGVST